MILCSRAKQPIIETIVEGQKTFLTLSWEPIQDKRLKYEISIVVPMTLDGGYETDPDRLKVPGDLAHLFRGELLDEATGAAIAEWVTGGKPGARAAAQGRVQGRRDGDTGLHQVVELGGHKTAAESVAARHRQSRLNRPRRR